MRTLLRNLKTERGNRNDGSFSFCFNSTNDKIDGGAVLTMLENRFHSIFWQINLAISNSD